MIQCLGMLATLEENPDLVPSAHIMWITTSYSSSSRSSKGLWLPWAPAYV